MNRDAPIHYVYIEDGEWWLFQLSRWPQGGRVTLAGSRLVSKLTLNNISRPSLFCEKRGSCACRGHGARESCRSVAVTTIRSIDRRWTHINGSASYNRTWNTWKKKYPLPVEPWNLIPYGMSIPFFSIYIVLKFYIITNKKQINCKITTVIRAEFSCI